MSLQAIVGAIPPAVQRIMGAADMPNTRQDSSVTICVGSHVAGKLRKEVTMAARTITVTVPEDVYTQLEAQARTSARSIDDLVTQTLVHALPPQVEGDLPPSVQAELQAMAQLSDEALWAIAGSTANEDRQALYDVLIERQDAGSLTMEGRRMLVQLREEADALMVRKAHAYALLHGRGYTLPSLDELRSQTR